MRQLLLAFVLTGLVPAWGNASPLHEPRGVRIDPTSTRVMVASVHLELGDLEADGEELTGAFQIRVPMFPWKDDHGQVRMRLGAPLRDVVRRGGVLEGEATSDSSGHVRQIHCEVRSDGSLRISVTMPDRVLEFDSRYRILPAG